MPLELFCSFDSSISDESPSVRTLTTVGGAAVSSAQVYQGAKSLLTAYAGGYAYAADDPNWDFAGIAFEINLYVRVNSLPAGAGTYYPILAHSTGGNPWRIMLYEEAGETFRFVFHGFENGVASTSDIKALNTWYHLRVVGNASVVSSYVDSVLVATVVNNGAANNTPLYIGGYPGLYTDAYIDSLSIFIGTPDSTPDAFTFTDSTGVEPSSVNTSNTITISGITTAVAVTLTGTGSPYMTKNGVISSDTTTAVSGDIFIVYVTASGSYSTATTGVLTVGGVSDTYSVTTRAEASVGGYVRAYQAVKLDNNEVIGHIIVLNHSGKIKALWGTSTSGYVFADFNLTESTANYLNYADGFFSSINIVDITRQIALTNLSDNLALNTSNMDMGGLQLIVYPDNLNSNTATLVPSGSDIAFPTTEYSYLARQKGWVMYDTSSLVIFALAARAYTNFLSYALIGNFTEGTVGASSQKSFISVTLSGTTATATVSNHGYSNGNSVLHSGFTGTSDAYNGTFTISGVTTNTYQFTVTTTAESPATPATGTLVLGSTSTAVSITSITGAILTSQKVFGTTQYGTTGGYNDRGWFYTYTVTTNVNYTFVTGSAHGLLTGNSITISGCTKVSVNGTHFITRVDATTFYITIRYTQILDAGTNQPFYGNDMSPEPYTVGTVSPTSCSYIIDVSGVTISSITRSSSIATVTTGSAHGFVAGQSVTISGATQDEYNGIQVILTTPDTTHFTYAVTVTAATPVTPGVVTGALSSLATSTMTSVTGGLCKSRVRWGDTGSAQNGTIISEDPDTNNAGYIDFADTEGEVKAIYALNDRVIVLKTSSLNEMIYTGYPAFFSPKLITVAEGCVGINASGKMDVEVFFIGKSNFWIYGPKGLQPIGDPVKNLFFGPESLYSASELATFKVITFETRKEIWLWYPLENIVYKFIEGGWYKGDYSSYGTLSCIGKTTVSEETVDSPCLFFQADTFSGSSTFSITSRCDIRGGNDASLTAYFVTHDYSIPPEGRITELRFQAIADYTDTDITVYYSLDEGNTWDAGQVISIQSSQNLEWYRIWINETSESIRFKVTTTSAVSFGKFVLYLIPGNKENQTLRS